jgi:hypothetical protein
MEHSSGRWHIVCHEAAAGKWREDIQWREDILASLQFAARRSDIVRLAA